MPKKERLDQLLVTRGLAESVDVAERMIRAGEVRLASHRLTKPGECYAPDIRIEVHGRARFVSRGGKKLEGAFDAFSPDVTGLVCLDVGSSTGGFTDCLLQHGAGHVISVDVGKGLLDWKLRNDDRVTVIESFNARYLGPEDLSSRVQFAVTDVSFISLTKILPAMVRVLESGGYMVSLIKPQFEAPREQVEHGGVVRDEAARQAIVERIKRFGEQELALKSLGVVPSPVKGPKGNVEFLAYWRK